MRSRRPPRRAVVRRDPTVRCHVAVRPLIGEIMSIRDRKGHGCHRLAARLRPLDPLAGDARPDRRAGRCRRRRAREGRDRGLGRAPARPPGRRRPVGRRHLVPKDARDHVQPDAAARLRTGPRERGGSAGRRPRPRAQPLGARRPALLRGRSRALHQRQGGHHRRLLRPGRAGHRRSAADRTDGGRRAGTASRRTARRAGRSIRRSACSRASSSTSEPPEAPRR